MRLFATRRLPLLLLPLLAACAVPGHDAGRYLVYFEEFSADLSPTARKTIADAAQQARQLGATGIRVEARASATGTPETNMKLAETRAAIVSDELRKDGIAQQMIQQVPIGQTGSGDPTVAERRVDIVIER